LSKIIRRSSGLTVAAIPFAFRLPHRPDRRAAYRRDLKQPVKASDAFEHKFSCSPAIIVAHGAWAGDLLIKTPRPAGVKAAGASSRDAHLILRRHAASGSRIAAWLACFDTDMPAFHNAVLV